MEDKSSLQTSEFFKNSDVLVAKGRMSTNSAIEWTESTWRALEGRTWDEMPARLGLMKA